MYSTTLYIKFILDLEIINIDKNTSDTDIKECVDLLLTQMTFIGSPSTIEKVEQGLRLAIDHPEMTKVFAAKNAGGEIVGILLGNKGTSMEKFGYYLWINELHVKETERKKGIGTSLLNHVFNWCKSEGIRGITLAVAIDNEIAKKLYHKHGFDSEPVVMYNKFLK